MRWRASPSGKVNALITLNLRPGHRAQWGFDARTARSQTDPVDDDPALPDALEVAAAQDRQFAKTGKLVGPLHGVVMAIKDQYDTAEQIPFDHERGEPPDPLLQVDLVEHQVVTDGRALVRHQHPYCSSGAAASSPPWACS